MAQKNLNGVSLLQVGEKYLQEEGAGGHPNIPQTPFNMLQKQGYHELEGYVRIVACALLRSPLISLHVTLAMRPFLSLELPNSSSHFIFPRLIISSTKACAASLPHI